ncbi:DUF1905 domain-containing protein [Pseudarthrobacter sp. NamE5]|uniref:DUF1905 domain-containing protein n=1 Tax=Pseudarthrobacter sp. NamE5 TaxID=2576839 RepID=UPI00110A2DDD|nr:DUF1905 domain-containing protein [Pseudarthrobacter sp. NamE5]TLM83189.1 DUF1905 domain-containing protein [Pseudarthrobacter sp. NamE5]
MTPSYAFTAELWLYPGEAAWHFLTLPADVADGIADHIAERSIGRKAFGSVKVTAEIGSQTWQTSIFPDTKAGSYLLPVKKAVRDKARIKAGDSVAVRLELQPDSA